MDKAFRKLGKDWGGELNIFTPKSEKPAMNLRIELHIETVNDSVWNWNIIYINADKTDKRKYELHKTLEPNKWVINEKNGIKLNQTLIGNRLICSFSLEKTLLVTSYWLENEKMNFEIVVTNRDAETTTGLGDQTSPKVGNHTVNTFHRGIMSKMK